MTGSDWPKPHTRNSKPCGRFGVQALGYRQGACRLTSRERIRLTRYDLLCGVLSSEDPSTLQVDTPDLVTFRVVHGS